MLLQAHQRTPALLMGKNLPAPVHEQGGRLQVPGGESLRLKQVETGRDGNLARGTREASPSLT